MSRLNKLVNLAANVAAYRRQLAAYRMDVAEAAKEYVDSHCDNDSIGVSTDKYMALEKAVKKLRALENL